MSFRAVKEVPEEQRARYLVIADDERVGKARQVPPATISINSERHGDLDKLQESLSAHVRKYARHRDLYFEIHLKTGASHEYLIAAYHGVERLVADFTVVAIEK